MAGTATATGRKRATRRAQPRGRRGIAGLLAGVRVGDLEVLLVIALFGAAMLARWPYLLRLPHFTDEIGEIRWALSIFNGEQLPLTAQVKYFGPLQHYILAICFWIFGPSILLPRLLVAIFGGLTVVLTYLVGRELGGWKVGALGAALLATLPQHIVVNSHVAWQNSTTPFYSTLAAYCLLRALRAFPAPERARVPRWARWLLLAGVVCGLMLMTHIGTIVLAPAFAGAVLLALWCSADRRAAFRRFFVAPWPYLAVLLVPLAYSPVLIDNARSGWAGYWRAQGRDYAYVQQPSLASYLANLRDLLFELMRMLSNPFRIPERPLHYLTSGQLLIATALCLLGLAVLARQRRWLPLLLLLSTAALMPRFNHAYGVNGDRYLVTGRYIAFLLPPLTIALAAGALALSEWALARFPPHWRGLRLRDAALVASLALIVLLVLYPIVPLRRYYTREGQLDPDNATFLATVRSIDDLAGPRTPVLIGALLAKVDLKDGANSDEVLDVLLTLEGIPPIVSRDTEGDLQRLIAAANPADPQTAPLAILTRDECFAMRDRIPLERVSGRLLLRELYWTVPSYYGIYRYNPAAPGGSCLPASGATPGD